MEPADTRQGALSWSTSSLGDSTDTSPGELSELGDHLHQCRRLSGRWASLRYGAEAVHGFVAARFVTTLVLVAFAFACASLVL